MHRERRSAYYFTLVNTKKEMGDIMQQVYTCGYADLSAYELYEKK